MKFHLVICLIVGGTLATAWAANGQLTQNRTADQPTKFSLPAKGKIQVAFVMSEGAVMIDFAGPWEVFSNVHLYGDKVAPDQMHPFHLYTVAESKGAIRASGGMRIEPDYTFEDAPQPTVVVVPAQGNDSPRVMDWIRKMTKQSDVVMSVCTGAFLLAEAGVLNGKKATTHHEAYESLQYRFPEISVQRGMRYVQSDAVVFTSGGLSSGIDLALHIVELYFGRTVAENTAKHMEYEGKGWTGDGSASTNFASPVKQGLKATQDNLDNNTYGNPADQITQEGDVVQYYFVAEGKFKGTLARDGASINGTFQFVDGTSIPVNWARVMKAQTNGNTSTEGSETSLIGDWTATVTLSGKQFRMVLHIRYSQ